MAQTKMDYATENFGADKLFFFSEIPVQQLFVKHAW